MKSFLSFTNFEIVIHAFITTRLDYCNSLYLGISQSSLNRLQMVQNAAARVLTGARKREHIIPVLQSLYWLPVHYRIHFKVLLLVFKSLNGLAPSYLSDLLIDHQPARALRSANLRLLVVPRTRLKSRDDRAFAVAAPRLWNSLSTEIRTAPTLSIFKSRLKISFIWSGLLFMICICFALCLAVLLWPCLCLNSVNGYLLCTAHWSTVVVFSCAL